MPEARLRRARELYHQLNAGSDGAAQMFAAIKGTARQFDRAPLGLRPFFLLSEQPEADINVYDTADTPWGV